MGFLKKTSMCLGVMCVAVLAQAAGLVRNVAVHQVRPWDGLVEITYELTEEVLPDQLPDTKVTVSNLTDRTVFAARTFTRAPTYEKGRHRLVWDARADGCTLTSPQATVEVTVVGDPGGLYQVIDLSGGPDAASYPIAALDSVPAEGWTDEYKTTKLVLRRIMAGTYIMGENQNDGSHRVTLTKPFYVGVFEVTQRQWELVMGTRPSYFSNTDYYASRPVECVSYDMIRGSSLGSQWPSNNFVDAASFLGKLREKTWLDFDLPTEAQWEYACRAGTTTDYNSGKNCSDANMNEVGRYSNNGGNSATASCAPSGGTAQVGSYRPNAWGLYDMHGNVEEYCLDWAGPLSYGSDPRGASSASSRELRGGMWIYGAWGCTSSIRSSYAKQYTTSHSGFRLSRALSRQIRVTLAFNANGGSCPVSSQVIEHWSLPTSLPTPTREGYEFVGWHTAPEGGTHVTEKTAIASSQTLYAHWNRIYYIVSFDARGGTCAEGRREVAFGECLSALPEPMREDYEFLGWYTAPDGGTCVAPEMAIFKTQTLYAHWERHEVGGLYQVVDLSEGPAAASYPVTALDAAPADGWTDEYKTTKLVLRRIDAGSYVMGEDRGDTSHRVTLTKPFYVGIFEVSQRQWELVMGTRPSYFRNDECYASRPVEQVSYDEIRGSSPETRWPMTNTVDVSSFLGMLREKTGFEFDLPTEAQWEYACRAGTATDYNSGKNCSDDNMKEVGRYADNGGSSAGSTCDFSGGTAQLGSYLPNDWGLYDMHGNVAEWCLDLWDPSGALSYGIDPCGPSEGGSRMVRGGTRTWDEGGCKSSARQYHSSIAAVNDVGFRVFRTLPRMDVLTLSFDANGGDCSVWTQDIAPGGSPVSLPLATRDGYVFSGWFTAVDGGTRVTSETVIPSEQTLHAHWERIYFTVTFDANGGACAEDSRAVAAYESLSTLPSATREDYVFLGWYTAAEGGERVTEETVISSAQTVYAHWKRFCYVLTFDANGGTCSVGSQEILPGDTPTALPTATRSGYEFLGWFTAAEGGERVTEETVIASAQTAYAHWERIYCTLTFDANGGSCAEERRVVPACERLPDLPSATRENYVFLGWYTAAGGGMRVTSETVISSTQTLYAHWELGGPYQVIDLSGGTKASSYPVTVLNAVPADGWTDEYKTTKLVLRRIEAGSYMMQNSGAVTLTRAFYIGVFEVTQRQWELVMGTRPSYFSSDYYYASRPVESVTYAMIRGSSLGAQWPTSSSVDASSFLGMLRKKTGIDFDLPTEAQWEYACRAGTSTDYNSGKGGAQPWESGDEYMDEVGRYNGNGGGINSTSSAPSKGTAKVGSYLPNAWGLYDMHGNVWEWCLDWFGESLAYGVDPKGPSSGTSRMRRGGSWWWPSVMCTSFFRRSGDPFGDEGFRLCRTMSR